MHEVGSTHEQALFDMSSQPKPAIGFRLMHWTKVIQSHYTLHRLFLLSSGDTRTEMLAKRVCPSCLLLFDFFPACLQITDFSFTSKVDCGSFLELLGHCKSLSSQYLNTSVGKSQIFVGTFIIFPFSSNISSDPST
jgi:hypothetical protein